MRLLCLLLALAASAWFAIGIRQSHDTDAATAIVTSARQPSPAQLNHARALLREARLLNPDAQVDLLRGEVQFRAGNLIEARSIFASITRREPQNLLAWNWLGRASADDPASFLVALKHVRELAPPVP